MSERYDGMKKMIPPKPSSGDPGPWRASRHLSCWNNSIVHTATGGRREGWYCSASLHFYLLFCQMCSYFPRDGKSPLRVFARSSSSKPRKTPSPSYWFFIPRPVSALTGMRRFLHLVWDGANCVPFGIQALLNVLHTGVVCSPHINADPVGEPIFLLVLAVQICVAAPRVSINTR